MKTLLHHFAYNIRPKTLELLVSLFLELDCEVSYQKDGERWCLLAQKSVPVDIQIIERDYEPLKEEQKINTHIAFISDEPEEVLNKISFWAEKNKIDFKKGAWSDKEFWFDLPGIFINFVIEIMHDSIESN